MHLLFANILLTISNNTRSTFRVTESEVVIAAFITAIASIIVVIIKVYGSKIGNKRNKDENINLELEKHPYFARTNVLKNYIRSYFVLENKGKEVIFKNILWNYISIMQEELLCFIKIIENRTENLSSIEFYNLIMETFEKINERQNTYYLTSPEYNAEEKDVLTNVISKFNVWNTENINYIQNNLETLSNSYFYMTDKVKTAAVLDFCIGISVHIVNNASKTLNSLNGDLEGLVFRGIKVEKCHE